MTSTMSEKAPESVQKSSHAQREESILRSWQEKGLFEKTLAKESPQGEFVFFEGPPTANGRPGIHHLEARAFKDAIPRYKTMQGYHVRRKGGWDTHGLPVELQVEKELGLRSKKEIEAYGVAPFNEKCKESVWKYVHEWEDFTRRMGYWVDLKDPYVTYHSEYIESVWNIMKTVDEKKLLYKDYKVVPWCPRCGTGLSSHELAQGYEEVKDLTVYVKFKVKAGQKIGDFTADNETYVLAWTTTPWTLPGNVALAVGKDIEYVHIKIATEHIILAKERVTASLKDVAHEVVSTFKGSDLVGVSYEPLYTFLKENLPTSEKVKLENAFKVYAGDFVTTTDGTGIVHIAPMYGQDDFELGTKNALPKYHLVNDDGTFKKECGFLAGRFVKEKDDKGKPTLDVDIIDDLKKRGLFFAQESYKHTYPHCWRCHTPLIYFARDSWYIRMSELRDKLVKGNEGIHWEPGHIKEGRFGEWLREIKDWAISRERYWGTPLPIWHDESGKRHVIGSVDELKSYSKAKNTYFVMRHGQAEHNVKGILNSDPKKEFHLTQEGRAEVVASAQGFKEKIDVIYCSPFIRTRETAEEFARTHEMSLSSIVIDDRLHELKMGELEGANEKSLSSVYKTREEFFTGSARGVENRNSMKRRTGSLLEEVEKKHSGKNILFVSHDGPLWMLEAAANACDIKGSLALKPSGKFYLKNAEIKKIDYVPLPHNTDFELDLHRPFIDDIELRTQKGEKLTRVKEVMDVWFDSGAMPFAQDHYPFNEGNKGLIFKLFGKDRLAYPADFISEAIDQTRGWFYTLHAIGTLMGKGPAYKNVICLGHILDAEGKKMSKSVGNVVNPWDMMDLYGADALRFWMYSVNQPGDSKNFDQKTVDEVVKKVFNLAANVLSFYKMYEDKSKVQSQKAKVSSQNILDQWIIARLNEVVATVTRGLDNYVFLEPTRSIRDFIGDLSQWYLRRSRDRFKGEDVADKEAALATTRFVLITLAKLMAPFTPFFAEYLYSEAGGPLESVHLENWPMAEKVNADLITDMNTVRVLASKGLEARMKAKINVRQPLAVLKVKAGALSEGLTALVLDEVNVKGVQFGASIETDVELDLNITPALKEEGEYREFLRAVQDLRKEKGLSVGDRAVLVAPETNKTLVSKFESEIKKIAGISSIEYGAILDIRKS